MAKHRFVVGRFIIFILFILSCVVFWKIIDTKYKGFLQKKTEYMKNLILDLSVRKEDFYKTGDKKDIIYIPDGIKEKKITQEATTGSADKFIEELTKEVGVNTTAAVQVTQPAVNAATATAVKVTKHKEEKTKTKDEQFYEQLAENGDKIKNDKKAKGYYLQLGIFSKIDNVNSIKGKLKNYSVTVIQTTEGYSKVTLGSGLTMDEAKKLSNEIETILGKEYKPMIKAGD